MDELFDVVIVGTGISGAIVAKELGRAGKKVLLLDAGEAIPDRRSELMERFYLDTNKYPESPYGRNPNAPSASVSDLFEADYSKKYLDQPLDMNKRFGSTYERRAGGTMWHWMGTCLRLLPNDFKLKTLYGRGVDWPISYDDLGLKQRRDNLSYYDLAEQEIGVSANVGDQQYGPDAAPFRDKYAYPNPAIALSRVDQFFTRAVDGFVFDGQPVKVVPTPAGRNSRPYDNRRACAGNTNCVPICPIEAKYDPTVTLHKAFNTGNVSALFQHIATKVITDQETGKVTGIEFLRYGDSKKTSPDGRGVVRGRTYVLAANAIETPKLLLMSGFQNANIGRNLMDHPFYVKWGLTPSAIYPYRGPLSTAGLDNIRDGAFRNKRSAFRIEIGNDGWLLPISDPRTTLLDFIEGTNNSQTNIEKVKLFGRRLIEHLNSIYTRQCRIGFELEQLPLPSNRVTLSSLTDSLGLPRPKIEFSYSQYEADGLLAADRFTDELFSRAGIEDKTGFKLLMGAGHIMGTHRMGTDPVNSVVNHEQRCWDFHNLFLIGSGVFPSGGTANPSLTIAALAFWAADTILSDLSN